MASIKYSKMFDKYAVGQLHATVEVSQEENKNKEKSVFILCLDKSGSMSGQPINAVREGALEVAKMHSQNDSFDKFLTLSFGNKCNSYEYTNLDSYQVQNKKLRAGGGTSFSSVFDNIKDKYLKDGYSDYTNCTIMFMTDGLTDKNSALQSLNELKAIFKMKEVTSRFLCIGFSQYHDADLLGTISRSGSDMGNFVYVKEQSETFKEEIIVALKEVFDLAPGSSSLKVEICEDTKEGYSMNTRINLVEGTKDTFSAKVILPLEIMQSKHGLMMKLDQGNFDIETIENESQDKVEEMAEIIYFFNNHIFSLITNAQMEENTKNLENLYEEVKELDSKLNETYRDSLTIKKKEDRKKYLEPIQDLKQKIVSLTSYIRDKKLGKSMSNDFIASLNAMAYSGVRGNAMQKKLDGRAMLNEERYTKLNEELSDYVAKLDMDKIREENKEISGQIGDCFLTTQDAFECIESQDCLCICLDITRSEAAIADPTKLNIKKIIPNFLSADSFIDAAKFALAANPMAHGGFEKDNNAQILVGVGREDITGALPLFLFKEHFEIARKKVPQLLGLMCTCDPMGYTPAQFFVVPFLVLHRAFTDFHSEQTEIRKLILDQTYATCKQILNHIDKEGKKKVLELLEKMVKDPIYSTQEHVSSISLLLSQILVLKRSEKLSFDTEDLEWVFQILIEESDRRSLDQKSSTITNSEICKKYLYPYLEEDIQEILENQPKNTNDSPGKKRDEKEEAKKEDADVEMKDDSTLESKTLCFCTTSTCEKDIKSKKNKSNSKTKKNVENICPSI